MADLSSKLNSTTNPQTRCSNCQTVFEVARELLSSSDTRVRCGECLSIFDALEELHLADPLTEELLANGSATTHESSDFADAPGSHSPTDIPKRPIPSRPGNETAVLDITYSDFDIFSKEADLPEIAYFDQTRDTPDFDFDAVEMGNDETFNDYLFAHDVTIDANSPGNKSQQNSEYAEVDFVTNEQPREPLIFNYRDRKQPDPAAEAISTSTEAADAIPRAHGAQAKSIDSPSSVKSGVGTSASVQKRKSAKSPWLFRVGMLMLLCLLLVALFAYRARPQLYNNATLRPMLDMACNIMRCTLPARVDVKSLKMVKRNVYSHPSTPNALVINVSFRNDANFAQQLPVLQMVLSNRVGRIVEKQDFIPNQYMPNWQEGAVIKANEQLDVKLEVTDPGQDAQNFEFHFLEFNS